jgi:transcriptional regulator with XRE-family HTH domain
MDEVIITLGKRIRELRQHTGLSQERFAARAGLDRTYYAGIERGERNPSVKQLAKIAVALGVSVGALFDEESPPAG